MASRRIELVKHLSSKELEQGYRSSGDAVERSHWQIVGLYSHYGNADTVAGMVAYSPTWVRAIVKRYNTLGAAGLRDLRHDNPGQERVLSQSQEAELEAALTGEAEGLGLWTGAKVAAWIKSKTKQKVSKVTGWKYLLRLDQTLQVPRPKQRDAATPEAQAAFKKNSSRT
jgi:transposase